MTDVVIVLVLVVSGLVLIWLSKRTQLELGETAKTSLILAPLILYILLSGKLSEFEGLGWKAKFRSVGAESIIKAARTADLATMSDQVDSADFFKEAYWGFCRPYYLVTDRSAKSRSSPDRLDEKATLYIATAIRNSIICGQFIALVVVDDNRKPLGFFPRDQFLELLRTVLVSYGDIPLDSEAAFKQIAGSELGVILMNPRVRAQSDEASHDMVAGSDDIETVYQKMVGTGKAVALIVDRLGRFDGIITRSAIEGRIIQGLLAAGR